MIEPGDDADLVRGALNGRPAAFEDLVRRHVRKMFAICLSRVHDASTAEDMVQETFLRGYRSLGTLQEPEKFGSWLYGIAVRTCLDWLKSKKRTEVSLEALGNPGVGAVDGPSAAPEDSAARLRAAVAALPEEVREVVTLRYFRQQPYREIAGTLGIAPATVNLRLAKARELLRRALKEESA
jgi:RNA polymerase sigma-70 factor (ECF subfamily)